MCEKMSEVASWCWESFQSSPLLVQVTVSVLAVLAVTLPLRKWLRWFVGRHIPGLPRFYSPPLLGMAYQRSNKHHLHRLAMLESKGPLVQYYVFSAHIVLIGDTKLAKYALEQVKTKGSIMVSPYFPSFSFSHQVQTVLGSTAFRRLFSIGDHFHCC